MIQFFLLASVFVVFVWTIAIFVTWFSERNEVRKYSSYGIIMAAVFVLFEFLTLFAKINLQIPVFNIIISGGWTLLRIVVFTMVGVYYCHRFGQTGLPLLMKLLGVRKIEVAAYQKPRQLDSVTVQPHLENNDEPEGKTKEDITVASVTHVIRPFINVKQYLSSTLLVVTGSVLFSVLLFSFTSPAITDELREFSGVAPSASLVNILVSTIAVLELAFVEEIVFRLGIQTYIIKYFDWYGNKYWLAIAVTSGIWTLGHLGVLDPNWVKLVQVFPIGLAFGWLFYKYGAESSILAHGLLNVIMVLLTPVLFQQ
jgi:membrane protease YdiL (CAAX protease family)